MNKLKLWKEHPHWDTAEQVWDNQAKQAAIHSPIKGLKNLPSMPGITPETAKGLKWKSFKWMLLKDHQREILGGFLKHPFKYGWRYLKSLIKKNRYIRDDDFFLYGISSIKEFKKLVQDPKTLFVVGFSYCHKPFECPAERFTPNCIYDRDNSICQQCFIGKMMHALPDDAIPLIIPTVHYIGGKIFELAHLHPERQIVFLITACEMTLEMFSDWGNMVGIKGIGVRLDGRICNTMKAFELSEQGIKPGLTVILEDTQKRMLDIIKLRREAFEYYRTLQSYEC